MSQKLQFVFKLLVFFIKKYKKHIKKEVNEGEKDST